MIFSQIPEKKSQSGNVQFNCIQIVAFQKLSWSFIFLSRDIVKSETIRHISKDSVVICDGLNYVKGRETLWGKRCFFCLMNATTFLKVIGMSFIVPVNRIRRRIV